MSQKNRLPEIMVFTGSIGGEKAPITHRAKTMGIYINADDIKKIKCM